MVRFTQRRLACVVHEGTYRVYLRLEAKRRKRSTVVLEEGDKDSDESELSDIRMRIVSEVVSELSRRFLCSVFC